MIRIVLQAVGLLGLTGCSVWKGMSDQSKFEPLASLQNEDECIVRLYAAPIPSIEWLAVHTWFVVKPKGSHRFERWELWQRANLVSNDPDFARYGHVYKNLQSPEGNCGVPPTYVLREVTGPAAETIASVVMRCSSAYPWRDRYSYYPGPNSNTYVAWILRQADWDAVLPAAAIGKDWLPFLFSRKEPVP